MAKQGWIYAITCDMYERDGIIKLGYTEKPDFIEEEVRTSLMSRYATTLIQPKILALIKVAHPKEAEKALFAKLKDYKFAREIFKCDFDKCVVPALEWLKTEFDPIQPYMIREEVLEKLLNKLRKKHKKLAYDLTLAREVFNWISRESGTLTSRNHQHLNGFMNMFPNPYVINTTTEWHKIPENQTVVRMRLANTNQLFNLNNWDRYDPNLHPFLKRLHENL